MTGTPILVGPTELAALRALRERASKKPVDMRGLVQRLQNKQAKRRHMRQMTRQTVYIPAAYAVTFSIETNHPEGRAARHMSMSVDREGRVPSPLALWMIAEELGFVGGLAQCQAVWLEHLQGHGTAVNVVQFLVAAEGRA